MRFGRRVKLRRMLWIGLVITVGARAPSVLWAQLQFTEVMHNPLGDENRWEWVEVRNTSASPINLDGWIFDDDDDAARERGRGFEHQGGKRQHDRAGRSASRCSTPAAISTSCPRGSRMPGAPASR